MFTTNKSKYLRHNLLVHESTTKILKLNLHLLCINKYNYYFYWPKIDTQSSFFLFFSLTVACYNNQIINLDRVSVVHNIG